MNDNNSLQANEYYKNLNKNGNCSKCKMALTQNNYRNSRTVCKLCYNNQVLGYYRNKFCSNSSPKSDVCTQADSSDNQDCCRKQVRSRKQISTRKQVSTRKQDGSNKEDSSNKQDISIIYITDVDPDLLCDKIRETLSKSVMSESDYTMTKILLDEFLRVRCFPLKQYNAMCEKNRIDKN